MGRLLGPLLLVALGSTLAWAGTPSASPRLDALADRYTAAREARELDPDLGPAARATWLAKLARYQEELARIAVPPDSQAGITWRMLETKLARERAYLEEGWVKEDVAGSASPAFAILAGVLARQRRSIGDWERTLATLRRSNGYVAGYLALLDEGLAEGRVADRPAVRSAIERLEPLTRRRPDNPFLVLRRELAARLAASTAEERPALQRLAQAFDRVLADEVLPAHRRLLRYLRARVLPRAEPTPGRRRDRYLRQMALHLGADHPSPEALGRFGRREVARLLGDLERTVRTLAPGTRSVSAFMRALRRDPANRYRSAADLLAAAELELQRAVSFARTVVPVPPTPLALAPVPRHEQATTVAQYVIIEGQPPRYELQLNLGPLLRDQFRHELPNLMTHEAYPGHHLAQAVAERAAGLPRFRRRNLDSAFDEGWAFYVEALRDEQGGFVGRARVGHLIDQLWRAARLVVDTGLHTGTMTPRQAARYFRAVTFSTPATARAEIQRYLEDPAEALAYAYGRKRLLRTRAAVQAILGPRFDLRRFHAKLLSFGAVPLAESHRALLAWAHRLAAQPLGGSSPRSPLARPRP